MICGELSSLPWAMCAQKSAPGAPLQPLHGQRASLDGDTPHWRAASYPLQSCVDRCSAILVDETRERRRGHKGRRPWTCRAREQGWDLIQVSEPRKRCGGNRDLGRVKRKAADSAPWNSTRDDRLGDRSQDGPQGLLQFNSCKGEWQIMYYGALTSFWGLHGWQVT